MKHVILLMFVLIISGCFGSKESEIVYPDTVGGRFFNMIVAGDVEAVEEQLKQNPSLANYRISQDDPNDEFEDINGLALAALKDRYEILVILLEHGADPNSEFLGMPVTWDVVGVFEDQDLEKVQVALVALLDRGADPNARSEPSDNPLLISAASHYSLVTILLEYGADPNAQNDKGETAADIVRGYLDSAQQQQDTFEIIRWKQILTVLEGASVVQEDENSTLNRTTDE